MRSHVMLASAVMLAAGCNTAHEALVGTKAPQPKPAVKMTRDFAVPVLMYHRIDNLTAKQAESPLMRDLTVSPADFEAQIDYITKNGFTILLVSEVQKALLEGLPLPERAVAISM